MTPKQRISFFRDRWPATCKAQGWPEQDRGLRLRIISQALGRQVLSLNALDNTGDVDRVFAHLGMLCDNLAATMETEQPEISAARRLRWKIGQLAAQLGGDAYALAIARDKFHVAAGITTVDDLDAGQLRQLLITLSARARSRSRRAEPVPLRIGRN